MNVSINYKILLYKKVSKEFSDFISNMKKLPPDKIIEQAYEKVIKQDLLIVLCERELLQECVYLLNRQQLLNINNGDFNKYFTSSMTSLNIMPQDGTTGKKCSLFLLDMFFISMA